MALIVTNKVASFDMKMLKLKYRGQRETSAGSDYSRVADGVLYNKAE